MKVEHGSPDAKNRFDSGYIDGLKPELIQFHVISSQVAENWLSESDWNALIQEMHRYATVNEYDLIYVIRKPNLAQGYYLDPSSKDYEEISLILTSTEFEYAYKSTG